MTTPGPAKAGDTPRPDLAELARTWLRIGCLSFGGPAGQIALMHRTLVDEKRWLEEDRYLHALSFCMLLPGPEAQQLAAYSGWLTNGWRGGLIAGGLFVLPGFVVLMALSIAYVTLSDASWFEALFFGLKAAVLVIVFDALLRIARRALKGATDLGLAAGAFLALFVFDLPFPLVVLAAGIFGYLVFRSGPQSESRLAPTPIAEPEGDTGPAALGRTVLVWGGIWALPFALIVGLGGTATGYFDIALFFSQMAMVTFGGAYAVLAYVAQQAVETYQWLIPGEMLDGLALAETTPGPLVLVLTYVGFLAGFREGLFDPLWGGVIGATLATWVTFAPCFLWVFAGAPHVERLRGNPAISAALAAITAAVVGVIANLALWFGIHVLFADVATLRWGPVTMSRPEPASVQPVPLGLTFVAGLALLWRKWSVLAVLGLTAGLGLAVQFVP